MCWEKVKSDYQLENSSSVLRALCLMGETNQSLLPQDAQCFASSKEGGSNTEEGWEGEEMPPRREPGRVPADGSAGTGTSCESLGT